MDAWIWLVLIVAAISYIGWGVTLWAWSRDRVARRSQPPSAAPSTPREGQGD